MTQFLIMTSEEDIASMNMRNRLVNSDLFKFKETELEWQDHSVFELERVISKKDRSPFFKENQIYLGLTSSPLIHLNDLKLDEADINPDLLIFASRHRSQTERPAFLTHVTGNWSENADFGGNPRQLSRGSAFLLKAGFSCLKQQLSFEYFSQFSDFSLDIEVTHHGPTTLEKPSIFMELGSSENEWKVEKAGELMARALIETCFKYLELKTNEKPLTGIGFGGTHYAPQFRKLISEQNVAISFICPKYYIKELDDKMIEQMLNNTLEDVDCFIVDWRGTNSAEKQHLIPLLEKFDVPIKKSKEFK